LFYFYKSGRKRLINILLMIFFPFPPYFSCRERLSQLRQAIDTAQTTATNLAFPSAFVTFKTRKSQVVAAGAMMSEDLSAWRTQAAPRPDEVIWKNLGLRQWERSSRKAGMWVAFFLLMAFFMIPVTAVQALLSTNSLVSFIQNIPIINSLVTAILPGLALIIFLALLPPILRLMRNVAGAVSVSQIDRGVVTWFFIFQVVTVFFGSFIAGTFANQFEVLIKNPGSIVTILGTAAPQTAIFFMTFLLAQALISTPLFLLRVFGLIMFLIKSRFTATPRAKLQLQENALYQQTYGTQIPADTIAALLGFTFCLICPIIAPLALLYFAVSYLVNKYHVLAVAKESYQSGGLVWLQVFNQLITGLIIFQITMVGLLGIKKAPAPSLIILPLPFITLIFAYVAHATFSRPMSTLSLLTAARRDAVEADESGGDGVGERSEEGAAVPAVVAEAKETYLAPSFKIE
jgi:Calcium-dependent channel, 7TM region, putative phosphate/Cytosolic domain of 10TM putative phosphate transporter